MTKLPDTVRIIPLEYRAQSHIGFTVRAALNGFSQRRGTALPPELDQEIGARILALHTKYHCLKSLVHRITKHWRVVSQLVSNRDPSQDGWALSAPAEATWSLVADAEYILVLLNSTLSVAVKLYNLIETKVLGVTPTKDLELYAISGLEPGEQDMFRDLRNDFVHEYAPWLEVILHGGEADLSIHTGLSRDYTAGHGYILLSRLQNLASAVAHHLDNLEDRLAKRLAAA